ncbi:MAG TPA: tripartite tricarboxylate transporter substrate binding protein [Firmicutes bacterium]|jgi:tripartite-type tricarboxylate transporter receptor subunit TctC|nr:tripartite tricarboxylate transporter substrate binding protein [Bacillota bacterium]
MLKNRLNKLVLLLVLAAVLIASTTVFGAWEPRREITIIIPWSPGGATDIMARKLQPIIKREFGVNTIVLNKEGGSSAVGLTELITSRPDGYTVALASSTILSLMGQNQISWGSDRFTNLCLVSEDPMLLAVNKDAKWKNLDEFLADVKANPGKITIGTSASRNVNHADAVLAAQSVGSSIRQVPFNGGSRVIAAVLGGHVDALVLKPSETISQIQAGELRPLGIYRKERLASLPEVPTFQELGYDVFPYGPVDQISYLVAPAGLKKDVKDKLVEIFRGAMLSEEFQEFSKQAGFVCNPIYGNEFDKYIENLTNALAEVAQKVY